MFNMPMESDKTVIARIASKCTLTPFVPKNVKIETEEKKDKKE